MEQAEMLVECLTKRNETVATAESCTGGLVASHIVSVPGASAVFQCGYITYSDDAKHRMLQVSEKTLSRYTAVSRETAAEMAAGCAEAGQAELSLSVTGLAGPGGGTKDKPIGLVYIGCCYHGKVTVREYHFDGDRQQIREAAVCAALKLGILCMECQEVQ